MVIYRRHCCYTTKGGSSSYSSNAFIMSTLLTHCVSSVRSLRPPWRNPRRRSRLFLRASTFPAPDETPLDLTRVETHPPSFLKLSQLRKAFRVCAHRVVQCAHRNFTDLSPPRVPLSPKLGVKRRVLRGGLPPTETLLWNKCTKMKRSQKVQKLRGDLPRSRRRAFSCANIQWSTGDWKRRSHAGELGYCWGLLCRALTSRSACACPAAWGTCARKRGRTKRSKRERIRSGVLTPAGRSGQVLDITSTIFFLHPLLSTPTRRGRSFVTIYNFFPL